MNNKKSIYIKKIYIYSFVTIVSLFLIALFLHSQSLTSSYTTQTIPQTFNATTQTPYIVNITGSTSQFFQMSWNVVGSLSACSVSLDSAPDGTTWTVGGVLAAQTCTSNGSITSTSHLVNYIRINPNSTITGTGSLVVTVTGYANSPGSITGNSTATGALAIFTLAGGSTAISASPDITDNGTGTLSVGGPGIGAGTLLLQGSTSGSNSWTCSPATTCGQMQTGGSVTIVGNGGLTVKHLNQGTAGSFANSCTLSSGTCNFTINTTYTTPLCGSFKVSGTVTGILTASLSSTTLTITSSVGTDSGVVWGFCMGNPT